MRVPQKIAKTFNLPPEGLQKSVAALVKSSTLCRGHTACPLHEECVHYGKK